MEYTGVVGAMVIEQMAWVNCQVPNDETFSGDGLRQFIGDHENHLVEVEEGRREDFTLINWENNQLHWLVNKLLVQVMVLEGCQDSPLEIHDSPILIPIPPPTGQLLVEIDDINDEWNQAITKDLVEGQS